MTQDALKSMTANKLVDEAISPNSGQYKTEYKAEILDRLRRIPPEGHTTDVQRRLIGNLVTRFEMMPTDLEGIVNEQDRNFYEAMLQLVRAIEEGKFWPEPGDSLNGPRGPQMGVAEQEKK